MTNGNFRRGAWQSVFAVLAAALLLAGCDLAGIKEQQEKVDFYCRLEGTVRAEKPGSGDFVVVLLRHQGGALDERNNWRLVDHFVLEQPGRWLFYSSPGKYLAVAFQDRNHNQVFEHDEPALPSDIRRVVDCGPGGVESGLQLVIPEAGRIPGEAPVDISKLKTRSAGEQLKIALGQAVRVGEVASLDDPRFSRENATKGLWRPFDFLWDAKPGVYLLEPYRPATIPVLFVHGIDGTPRDFSYLIEKLDRSRFQAWVFYYPSGGRLDQIGFFLDQMITQLTARHGIRRLFVVAHSMGGLVARNFILRHAETNRDGLTPLFVSISSPWNGHSAARYGVDYAPTPIRVWYDMAPGSEFLDGLFYRGGKGESDRRKLPADCVYHLLFGFLPTESGDGTISVESELRWEAQEEARRLYGIKDSHVGILKNPRTFELLDRILSNPD